MDGLGMGLGFTIALTIAGALRELIGNGTLFGADVMPAGYEPIGIFVQPPGAFLVIAFIIMIMNAIGIKTRQKKLVESGCDGCYGNCASRCESAEGGDDK
jgi:electron transport complex protein RnfE